MQNNLSKNKGYALISNEYIEGNCEEYHIFPVREINFKDNNVTYQTKLDIKIFENKECKENPKPKQFEFENLSYGSIVLMDIKNFYRYKRYEDIHHIYYVGYDNNVYYFEDDITAKIVIASFMDRKACGTCMSMLYGSKNH